MATFNSLYRRSNRLKLLIATLLLAIGASAHADDPAFQSRLQKAFQDTKTHFQANTNDNVAAWQFAKACFEVADNTEKDRDRATAAQEGIAVCRQIIDRDPHSAPGHYYLAMNLGEYARTKLWGALKLIREMEYHFKIADQLDEHFDNAGAARNLGVLYREAPSFGSIGSKKKAREWIETAVKIEPNYPENQLNLIESCIKWDESDEARHQLEQLNAIWAGAQKKFAGTEWTHNWSEWTARRDAIQKKLNNNGKPLTNSKN